MYMTHLGCNECDGFNGYHSERSFSVRTIRDGKEEMFLAEIPLRLENVDRDEDIPWYQSHSRQ